jgi:hypothetical protein
VVSWVSAAGHPFRASAVTSSVQPARVLAGAVFGFRAGLFSTRKQHMQRDTIGSTIAALLTMAGEARRLAASLQRYQSPNHRDFAALHRLALVAQEFGEAIVQAEAALSPSARNAIAELVS